MNQQVISPQSEHSRSTLIRSLQPLQPYAWLLAAILIGFLLRLPGLGSRPMWYDEAFSVLFSSAGPKAMAYGTLTPVGGAAADVHPLLYYSLLWSWMKLVGTSAFAVRMLSVVIGLGIIGAGWRLAADLFNRDVANTAGILLALSPFEIHYAQEARMYALLALLCLLSAIFYQRGIANGRWREWLAFGICAALAMYAHILAAGVLLVLGIAWLIWDRRKRTAQFFIAVGLALLLYAPWLVQLPSQVSKVGQAYWIERPGILELIQTVVIFVTDLPLKDILLPLGLFIAILALSLAIWQTLKAQRNGDPEFAQAAWIGTLALVPPILIFGISQFRPVFILRGLLPSVTFFVLWSAWVLVAIKEKWIVFLTGLAMLILASGIGLVSRWDYSGFPYAPYGELAEEIETQLQPGQVVLHSNKLTMLPMVYAAPDLEQRYMADIPGSGSDTLALPTQEVLELIAYEEIDQAIEGAGSIIFIIFEREIAEYQSAGTSEHPYLAQLEDRFDLVEVSEWGELRVYVFE